MSEPAGDFDTGTRVVRHGLADRLYHWLMAAAMLVLLATACAAPGRSRKIAREACQLVV